MSDDGGYLVPPELERDIRRLYLSGVLQWATRVAIQPTSYRVIQFPVYIGDGNGPRAGTITDLRYPNDHDKGGAI